MKSGTAFTGTETSCLIEPPSYFWVSAMWWRRSQNALVCSRLSAMVASSISERSAPVARMSSMVARMPSRACDDSSSSTYQACLFASGSRQVGRVLHREFECDARNELEARDAAAGALVGEIEQRERCVRGGQADEGGLDRARAREQAQHRSGDDAERAFSADEDVAQVVAGVVLLELAQIVEHASVGEHDFESHHQFARDAIGERAGAAGIGREVAADGAAAFRAERQRKQTVLLPRRRSAR